MGCVGFAFSITSTLIGLGQWKSFLAQFIEGTRRTALIVMSIVADCSPLGFNFHFFGNEHAHPLPED